MKDKTKLVIGCVISAVLTEGICHALNEHRRQKELDLSLERTKKEMKKVDKEFDEILGRMDKTIKEGNSSLKEHREWLEQHKKSNKES